MTRTLLLCLLMVAWPWTVKAQVTKRLIGPGDKLDSCYVDGKPVPLSVCDSILADTLPRWIGNTDDFGHSATAPKLIVSLDSASLARIERIIDSTVQDRIAKMGRWRMRVDTCRAHQDDSILVWSYITFPCTTYVWVRTEGK